MLGIRMREGLELAGPGGGAADGGDSRGPGGADSPKPAGGGWAVDGGGERRRGAGAGRRRAPDGGGRGRTPEHLVPVVARLVADGLLQPDAALRGRAVLTLRGRLMADAVTRALV